ncbi:hypothetical protein H0H81_012310 [Sphagnurus paluster]|uniref:T6SS Phospholipase effector Tle1-like catalytic domain-containing protein n=1 Tax=Sphagnurus paluster TaxID=117069 RepID=A0A9P7K731_9AGAR|nr:hypothetical protein H0H81_012310 [Sphagnurus paluster]
MDSPTSDSEYTDFRRTTPPESEASVEHDDTIPPDHEYRTLVLCFDGTGDQFDEDNSNIVNFFSMLKKDDPKKQLVYYQVGLLPKSNHQQVPFAYKMYSRDDPTGWKQSTAFKKAFSIDVDIELLGVWETVGSVGMIPKRLPFTTSNTHVRYFRHALALDEHRVRFKPNFWNRPTPEELHLTADTDHTPNPNSTRRTRLKAKETTRDWERRHDGGEYETDIEEVWFAGSHCDVGGGAVRNEVRNSLARIPLRWMVRQCFILKTGILFHRELFKVIGMDPDSLYPEVRARPPAVTKTKEYSPEVKYLQPRSGNGKGHTLVDTSDFVSEEEEDLADALSPVNDMLKILPAWWILEWIPQKVKYQGDDDEWVNQLLINRGRGRRIPRQEIDGVRIHRSVKLRMDNKKLHYKPKAQWNLDATVWVG